MIIFANLLLVQLSIKYDGFVVDSTIGIPCSETRRLPILTAQELDVVSLVPQFAYCL